MAISRYAALLLACLSGVTLAAQSNRMTGNETVDLWQLFQEAQDADPRIMAALAKKRSGAWNEREAFGQLLPQIVATSSFNRTASEIEPTRSYYNGERYSIGLSQVLYDPKIWHNYRRFAALATQQQAEYESALEQANVDLVERYFASLAAEDERDLVIAELHATQRNLDRVQSLFKRQLAMITDVLEISARVDALTAAKIHVDNEVTISREVLAEVVGRPISERLQRIRQEARFTLPPQDREYWVQAALKSNPALQARKKAVDAAEASVRQARAGHLPTVSLNLTAQRSDIGYENSLAPRTDTYVASIGMQLPLYSGGSTSAREASMHEQLMAAEHDHEIARRQVVRETRAAYYSAEASLSRIAASRTARTSAEKSRLAAERAFELGVMNAVDVLNSIQEEYRVRRDLLKSQYEFIMSTLVLRRWSGTLIDEDIRKANDWLVANGEQWPAQLVMRSAHDNAHE